MLHLIWMQMQYETFPYSRMYEKKTHLFKYLLKYSQINSRIHENN